ncbi:lysylphosphatidylglycerol synthase transmembrane domain-containing protein [Lacinutrix chionoecetis]
MGVFLVWYSLQDVPLSIVLEYWEDSKKGWIILGIILGLLSHLSRAYRWLFQLEPLGYKVKLGNSIMAVFATYLINYTIPRAGEVARASILTNYEGVPFDKGFGTIVAERIADLLVMLLIIMITLFLEFDFIYSFLTQNFNPTKIIIGFILLIAIGLFFIFYIRRSTSKIALKIKAFIYGLIEGAFSIFKMKKKWAFIFHTFFIWSMYVLMFYVTTLAIPGLENIPFGAVLIGFILASFSIAATNGGIGSYPVAVFTAFSIFSITKDPSYAFGWIMWASQTVLIIVFGGLSLLFLPIYNRKK